MSYFCETSGCLFHLKKWPYPVAGNCPECGQPFVLKVEFDSFEKDVINNYPYLIAFPFKRMLEETQFFTKFSLLKDVFVNTLKYNALLVATEYFKSPYKSEDINTLFINKLSRPFHGDWNQFLEIAIDFLEQKNYSFFVRELPFAYHSIETGKKNNLVKRYEISKIFTNHSGRVQTEKRELTAIRALLYYRNEMMAHRQTLDNDTFKKLYYTCYIILKDFLQAISFCKNYPMYKADRLYYWSLMGTEVIQAGRLTTEVSKDDNVWLQDKNGNKLSLLPFFVQPSQYIAGTNDAMQVLMYEGNTGPHGRIIFDSPESFKPEAEGEIVNKFYELLQVKQVLNSYNEKDFTKEKLKLQIDKHNRKVFKELKEEQKIIEGIYQKRVEAEVALLSWVGVKAGLFFLAADAGAGKTNLLWEIQRHYTKREIDALFIRASRLKEDDLSLQLIYLFHLINGFSYRNCETFALTQDKPLIILIDGGNEAANPEKFLESIRIFLNQFTIGIVKVVISWRINTQNDVPNFDESWSELYYNTNFITNPNNDLQKRHYWLAPLNKVELQSAWNNYVQHPTKVKYRVLFTLNELTIADKPLVDQLHNPLLLKIFLELYSGKELSSMPKGFTNIWAIWWNRNIAKEPNTSTFLIKLAVLMANNQANQLSLNSLYEDQDIGRYIRNYQIDNPYQKLLNNNVLTQFSIDNRLYVTFTIESVFHFALCQYLLQKPNTTSSLAEYATKGHQWEEAVLFYLWDAVYKQKIELIVSVIKNIEIPDSVFVKPLANVFLLIKTHNVLDSILTNSDNRTWAILQKAVDYIDKAQFKKLVKLIVQKTENWINLSQKNCVLFVSRYLMVFNKEFADNVADQIVNTLINIEIGTEDLELLNNLARYYEYVCLFDKANEYYQKYLLLTLKFYGEEHPEVATSYGNIASILKALGKYDEAMDYFHKCLKIEVKFYGDEHTEVATTYSNIASILKALGKYDEAMDYFHKCLKIELKFYGDEHPVIATSYGNIASILKALGKYDEAMDYFHKGLKIKLKFYGDEHPVIATSYSNIASILEELGKYDEAMDYFHKGLKIELKFYGDEHPVIATSYGNIASILKALGKYDEAMDYYHKGLKIKLKFYGDEHPVIATSYSNIASILKALGKYDEAMDYFHKGLKIELKFYGDEHPVIATSYGNIASILKALGKYDEAMDYYQKGLKIKLKFYGDEHPVIATSYSNIASILKALGKYDEAMDYFHKGLKIELKFYGDEHPVIATSYGNIASILKALGKYDEAMDYYQKGLNIKLKFYGDEHPVIATSYGNIASILEELGKYDEAMDYYQKSLKIKFKFYGDEHSSYASVLNNKAILLEKLNDFEEALKTYYMALEIKIKTLPKNHPDIALINRHIADIYTNQGLIERSLPHLLTVEKIFKQHFEDSHPKVADLDNSFGLFYEKKGDFKTALYHYQKAYKNKLMVFGVDNQQTRMIMENIKRIEISL